MYIPAQARISNPGNPFYGSTGNQWRNGWIGSVRMVGNYSNFIRKAGAFFASRFELFNRYSNESKGQCTNPLSRFDPIRGLAVGFVIAYPLMVVG